MRKQWPKQKLRESSSSLSSMCPALVVVTGVGIERSREERNMGQVKKVKKLPCTTLTS